MGFKHTVRAHEIKHEPWLCQDCMFVAVNGDFGDMDAERAAEVERGLDQLTARVGWISPNFDEDTGDGFNDLTNRHCDSCGTRLAGPRYRFVSFGREGEMSEATRGKEQPYRVVFTVHNGSIDGWIWATSERQAMRRLNDELGGAAFDLVSIKLDQSGRAPRPDEYEHSCGSKHFVRKLPGMKRISEMSRQARTAKDPRTMSGAEINKELDRLDKANRIIIDEMIEAGRGYENSSQTYALGKGHDPLTDRFIENGDRRRALRIEMELRYGPGTPSRLPRGFGPRNRAYENSVSEQSPMVQSGGVNFQRGERLRIRVKGPEGQPLEAFWYTVDYPMTLDEVALQFAQTGQPGMLIEIVSPPNSAGTRPRVKWTFRQERHAGQTSVTRVRED